MNSARAIRICAAFDLLVTAPFALPVVSAAVLSLMYTMNGWFGESMTMPETTAFQMLFVNLMGTLGVVWAFARLTYPMVKFGWIDAWARLFVAGLLVFYLSRPDVPVIICLFIATELIGAWLQFWVLRIPEI